MKTSHIDKDQAQPKKKSSLSIFEYGAIFAFVSVTVVVSAQLTGQAGFGAMNALNAMNEMSFNAIGYSAPDSGAFKAD